MTITALDPARMAVVVTNWDGRAYYLDTPTPNRNHDFYALVIAERGSKPYFLIGVPATFPSHPSLPWDFDGEVLGAVRIRRDKPLVSADDVDAKCGYAPPPEVFNAVTEKREPNPGWEYIEEKRTGSAVVHRYYTVPRT